MHRSPTLLLVPLLAFACEASTPERGKKQPSPSAEKTTAPAATATPVKKTPATKTPAPDESVPAMEMPAEAPALHGRWKGAQVCLELFHGGGFQLSVLSRGPKITIMGSVVQRRTAKGQIELTLQPSFIKRARWIGKCRKTVRSAKLLDRYSVLGVELVKGARAVLRLRSHSDGSISLCGKQCDKNMKPAPVRLAGRWRRPDMRSFQPKKGWKTGAVLGIKLEPGRKWVSLHLGGEAGAVNMVSGDLVATRHKGRQFELTMSARYLSIYGKSGLLDPSTAFPVLGGTIAKGGKLKLTAHRIKGLGIRVCRTPKHCNELPPFLSAY